MAGVLTRTLIIHHFALLLWSDASRRIPETKGGDLEMGPRKGTRQYRVFIITYLLN